MCALQTTAYAFWGRAKNRTPAYDDGCRSNHHTQGVPHAVYRNHIHRCARDLGRRAIAPGMCHHPRPAPHARQARRRGRALVIGGRRRAGQPRRRAGECRVGRPPDPPRSARCGLSARRHPAQTTRQRRLGRRDPAAVAAAVERVFDPPRRATCARAAARAWRPVRMTD